MDTVLSVLFLTWVGPPTLLRSASELRTGESLSSYTSTESGGSITWVGTEVVQPSLLASHGAMADKQTGLTVNHVAHVRLW
ncbi:MAG: hypothetical protein O3A81_01300 [bacterium]|nr:hypothetical protein [bacterium]